MSDTYTPDEEQVREQYTQEQPPHIGAVAEKHAEFDRFIARVKADALREAAGDIALALTEDVSTAQQDRMKFAIGYLRAKANDE